MMAIIHYDDVGAGQIEDDKVDEDDNVDDDDDNDDDDEDGDDDNDDDDDDEVICWQLQWQLCKGKAPVRRSAEISKSSASSSSSSDPDFIMDYAVLMNVNKSQLRMYSGLKKPE